MKTILVYIWKRHWCRLLFAVALLLTFALTNDFVRQLILGPKIDGIPWCAIEAAIRDDADPANRQSWLSKILDTLGFARNARIGGPPDLNSPSLLPVYLDLADDSNVKVRRACLSFLWRQQQASRDKIEPVLERHLTDEDPLCRVLAARGIWRLRNDIEMRIVLVKALDFQGKELRFFAVVTLCEMTKQAPDLFDTMAKLTEDPEPHTGMVAVLRMPDFGARGIPVVRRAFKNPDLQVRKAAVHVTLGFGKEAAVFIPDLLAAQNNDPDPDVRERISHALHEIDAERFPAPIDPTSTPFDSK